MSADGKHHCRHPQRCCDPDRRTDRKFAFQCRDGIKIEELTREARKHNGFAEKIPVIQRDIQVLNHRMSDIEVHEYEHERSNV